MNERINKTSICSVVFLDIIDYSKKSVSEQIDDKDCFNALISEAIKDVAQNDRIILDTGDGAAIALLGAPEEALFVSLTIRDGIIRQNKENAQGLFVRIGINLGPVRVVSDINGQPNIIGDGINVAQRVMTFAEPNQILVSRSYFEVTSRLTKEITQMFSYSGVKHDKHVREHEVYAIRSSAEEPTLTASGETAEPVASSERGRQRSGMLWYVVAGLALLAIAGAFLTIGEMRKPELKSSSLQPETAVAPAAVPPTAPPASAPVATADKPGQTAADSVETTSKKKFAKRSKPKTDATAASQTGEKQQQDKTEPAQSSSSKTGVEHHRPQDTSAEAAASSQNKEKSEHKSGWELFKESVKTGAEKKACTQAEIAMGQCH